MLRLCKSVGGAPHASPWPNHATARMILYLGVGLGRVRVLAMLHEELGLPRKQLCQVLGLRAQEKRGRPNKLRLRRWCGYSPEFSGGRLKSDERRSPHVAAKKKGT